REAGLTAQVVREGGCRASAVRRRGAGRGGPPRPVASGDRFGAGWTDRADVTSASVVEEGLPSPPRLRELRRRRGGLLLLLPLPGRTRLAARRLLRLLALLLLVLRRLAAVHQLEQDQRPVVDRAAA